jgi:hypothetical protein
MIRTLSKFVGTALVAAAFSASAFAACPASLQIKQLVLNSDGTVTRSVYIKKDKASDYAHTHFIPAVRDSITLEKGDSLVLNASPTAVDALFTVAITLQSQDRDDRGVISSTFHVVESQTNQFAGAGSAKTIRTAYLAKVLSNYAGNGAYNRTCGEVQKTNLDLESSSDARPIPATGGI